MPFLDDWKRKQRSKICVRLRKGKYDVPFWIDLTSLDILQTHCNALPWSDRRTERIDHICPLQQWSIRKKDVPSQLDSTNIPIIGHWLRKPVFRPVGRVDPCQAVIKQRDQLAVQFGLHLIWVERVRSAVRQPQFTDRLHLLRLRSNRSSHRYLLRRNILWFRFGDRTTGNCDCNRQQKRIISLFHLVLHLVQNRAAHP